MEKAMYCNCNRVIVSFSDCQLNLSSLSKNKYSGHHLKSSKIKSVLLSKKWKYIFTLKMLFRIKLDLLLFPFEINISPQKTKLKCLPQPRWLSRGIMPLPSYSQSIRPARMGPTMKFIFNYKQLTSTIVGWCIC